MKKALFAILLASAVMLPAGVTLTQAVADAWAISRGLDSQKLEEAAAAIAEQSALRRQRFAAHFEGSYRYSTDAIQVTAADFPFPLGPQVPAGTVILSTPRGAADLKVSLLQPLHAGGRLASAVKMEAARGAAERDLTRLKMIELAGLVKASFFNHLRFSRKRDSLNSLLASLDLHVKKVARLHEEELVRRSDLLEATAKADEVRLSLQDLEQLLAQEAVQFRSLCGHDPQEVDFQPAAGAGEFAAAWGYFLEHHPLLRSLDERARMLQARKRAAAAAYRPQVNAFAQVHYARPGQNFFVDEWAFYVMGGLSVSLPVFDWNQRGRDLELADIARRKLENQRADFIRESEKNLRQLYLSLDSIGRKLVLLEGLLANAGEDAALKEKLYEEQQIDHTLLLAAMAGQERYRSSRDEALAQIEMLKAAIDTLVGKFAEEG